MGIEGIGCRNQLTLQPEKVRPSLSLVPVKFVRPETRTTISSVGKTDSTKDWSAGVAVERFRRSDVQPPVVDCEIDRDWQDWEWEQESKSETVSARNRGKWRPRSGNYKELETETFLVSNRDHNFGSISDSGLHFQPASFGNAIIIIIFYKVNHDWFLI